MALDSLPGTFTTKTRDEVVESYLRDYKLRDPNASTAEGEQPDIDARVFADQLMPIYDAAKRAGNATALENKFGSDLDSEWEPRGLPRQQPSGAIGYVEITASTGGGPIFADDELKDPNSNLRFVCTETRLLWYDGEHVPIRAVDSGPTTNLAAGTVLQWSAPRPGIGTSAVIVEQSDGSGLSGGRDVETDEAYKERIRDYQANPPASGNDAAYQVAVETMPGMSVQKAFTWPGILGTGTIAVAALMKPQKPGASRRPSEPQRAAIEAYIVGLFPADDLSYFPTLLAQTVDVALKVDWTRDAAGWADAVPWPRYYAAAGQAIVVQSAASATSFVLKTFNSSYSGITAPSAGQTIGFYDAANGAYRRKRILSVTGSGPYTIVCDTTNSVSDTTYTPIVGQRACPWSDSLDSLIPGLLEVFDGLGPGEMKADVDLYDPGQRMRRSPLNPKEWPSTLASKALDNVLDIDAVQDGEVAEGATTATVGTPGVSAYVLELNSFAVFPKT